MAWSFTGSFDGIRVSSPYVFRDPASHFPAFSYLPTDVAWHACVGASVQHEEARDDERDADLTHPSARREVLNVREV